MYKLQDVNLKPIIGDEQISEMYYRTTHSPFYLDSDDKAGVFVKKTFLETFTYFGALSVEKWKKYTYAYKFFLVLDIEGNFDITLFGHYQENKVIKKEWLGKYKYKLQERTKIVIPFPKYFQSQLVAFSIEAYSTLIIKDAYYAAELEIDTYNNPYISLATTTFKKEDYIKRNIELLRTELFADDEFIGKFTWHIVDNGRTLETGEYGNISIVHNKNVGGAGGFAKGMIDSLRQEKKPTHILLMDDDVKVSPESFKRLYRLLNILRPEYVDYFVSGAMLNMDAPNIQHENTGRLVEEGYCVPMHSGRDLRLWDQVLLNEEIDDTIENRYAAWWFCCIPTSVATLDNLPLPVFVRGDDMEYSIRNHARFITMNGISIWHQGFVGKFNAPMEFYQSKRNELIVFTTRPELEKINSFKNIEELFWQQLYKFDYSGAEYLVDALEDYMKGPEWFSHRDLFADLSEKRKIESKPRKLTESISAKIDWENLYNYGSYSRFEKFIYDYTYNGQARIPEFMLKKKIGYIPHSFGYYPDKQMLTSINYAISPINGTYIEYKKDRKKFSLLKSRWTKARQEYLSRKDELAKRYQEYAASITNVEFWDEYLRMDEEA